MSLFLQWRDNSVLCFKFFHSVRLGYTNDMSWSKWHRWSTRAGGWLYVVLIFYAFFNEEEPFYWIFLSEEGTILLGKIGRRLLEFCLFMSKAMLEVGCSFILWSMLYLEGWSSRSSYFIGVALLPIRCLRDRGIRVAACL